MQQILIVLLMSISAFTFADTQVEDNARQEITDALIQPKAYTGLKSGGTSEPGTFCNKETQYWISWDARLGDVDLQFEDENTAVVHLEMDRSSVQGAGWRQGGILCIWSGGGGRATVEKTSVDFALYKIKPGETPKIEIRNASIKGLAMDRVDIAIPFFSTLDGEAPGWLNEWLEQSINSLLAKFMETSIKRRLDTYLGEKAKDWLERRQKPQGDLGDLSSLLSGH